MTWYKELLFPVEVAVIVKKRGKSSFPAIRGLLVVQWRAKKLAGTFAPAATHTVAIPHDSSDRAVRNNIVEILIAHLSTAHQLKAHGLFSALDPVEIVSLKRATTVFVRIGWRFEDKASGKFDVGAFNYELKCPRVGRAWEKTLLLYAAKAVRRHVVHCYHVYDPKVKVTDLLLIDHITGEHYRIL